MVLSNDCRAKRVRLARIGLGASALAAMALPVKLATPTEAKTPGSTYCYYGTCHRVKTIEETKALVGVEEAIVASHYDDCARDRYNPCGLTSSGERFHADRPDNTASPIYPDGTMLLVWSPDTGRALVVRVNNAGPYWGNRTLDLSRAAADKLGFEGSGVANVRVRVIKAPEPEEAVYVENRDYPPVPGDIGLYSSLDAAEQGMVVAMAMQAFAGSPMAPVTTANAFATRTAEMLVAEAPQALGRSSKTLAAVESMLTTASLGGLTQSLKPLRPSSQSKEQVAALDLDRDMKQSRWGEDYAPKSEAASATANLDAPKAADTKAAEAAEPKKVAANDDDDKPAKRRVERQGKQEKVASRSRKPSNGSNRVARDERQRLAYSAQAAWQSGARDRTSEQVISAGIRAQSSSTM